MFALGMLLQEDVTYDAKCQPQFDSTWDYKIPSAACIPREIIIRMLEVATLRFMPAAPVSHQSPASHRVQHTHSVVPIQAALECHV